MGADKKITDLTALASADIADLIEIIDVSEAVAADKNKKITYANLIAPLLQKDGSVGLTGDWDAGSHKITAEQFASDIAIGTAPFEVVSTTVVANLNADLLDGQEGSYYLAAANITAGALDLGANTLTVNSIEIVGADGEVNKAAVEDSGNWDSAYTHISSDGSDHSFIDQAVTEAAYPQFTSINLTNTGQTEFYNTRIKTGAPFVNSDNFIVWEMGGTDSVTSNLQAVRMVAEAGNTWGVGDTPARFFFLTCPDNSSTATEKLRLDSDAVWINFTQATYDFIVRTDNDGYGLYVAGATNRVAINQNNPQAKFEVLDATLDQFRITHTHNVDYAVLSVDTNGLLDIEASGSKILMVSNDVVLGNAMSLQSYEFGTTTARALIQNSASDQIVIGPGTGAMSQIKFRTNEGFNGEVAFTTSGYEFNQQNRAGHDFVINGTNNDQVVFNSGVEAFAVGKDPSTKYAKLEVIDGTDPQLRITHTENIDWLQISVDSSGDGLLQASNGHIVIRDTEAPEQTLGLLHIKQDAESNSSGIRLEGPENGGSNIIGNIYMIDTDSTMNLARGGGTLSIHNTYIEMAENANADCTVGIAGSSAAAKLHVDQSASDGARPVLYLDQADIDQEMIEFNTTIGVGNAIEAVGAKTLTTTHFIKVTLPGPLTRYIPAGTIA